MLYEQAARIPISPTIVAPVIFPSLLRPTRTSIRACEGGRNDMSLLINGMAWNRREVENIENIEWVPPAPFRRGPEGQWQSSQ